MKKHLLTLIILIASIVTMPAVVHAGWTAAPYSIPYEVIGQGPVVDAGPDKSITLPTSGISGIVGTATDPDGIIVTSTWSFTSGPTTAMVNQGGTLNAPTASFTNLTNTAAYVFTLTACDNDGSCGSDTMQVLVNPAPTTANLIGEYLSPISADVGSVTLHGRATNNGSVATGSTFTSYFEVQGSSTLTWTSPGITLNAGSSADVSASRTFTEGSYQVRFCADGADTVAEADEGDNCSSSWVTLEVEPEIPALDLPTASISVTPSTILIGESADLTWSCSSNSTSCVGTNFNTGGSNSGTVSVSPGSTTVYTVTATNADGSDDAQSTLTIDTGVPSGACSDSIDNDGDGKIDFGADRGCTSPADDDETDPKPIFIEF